MISENVIHFFNETWKKIPKPYKYNEYVAQKKNLTTKETQETRNTAMQPTIFIDNCGNRKYNKRKITELSEFATKLTFSLRIKIFCEYIFFNYEFLSGMFHCLSLSEISEFIRKAHEASSVETLKDNDAQMKSLNEIKLMAFMFLQCSGDMNEHPNSAISQIVVRSLRYYGYLKNFTNLIDQYDRSSHLDCQLLVPYQFLDSPGGDLILQLNKHLMPITACTISSDNDNSYSFSLSDNLVCFCTSTAVELGRIPVIKTESSYNLLITYIVNRFKRSKMIPLKSTSGGFLIADKHSFISYSFDSNIYFRKIFENEVINGIYMISSNHVLVGFACKNYVNIYNIYTS